MCGNKNLKVLFDIEIQENNDVITDDFWISHPKTLCVFTLGHKNVITINDQTIYYNEMILNPELRK